MAERGLQSGISQSASDREKARWLLTHREEWEAVRRIQAIDTDLLETLRQAEGQGEIDRHRHNFGPWCVAARWFKYNDNRQPSLESEFVVGQFKIQLFWNSIAKLWIPNYYGELPDDEGCDDGNLRWYKPFAYDEIRTLFPKSGGWRPSVPQYWDLLATLKVHPHPELCEICYDPLVQQCVHVKETLKKIETAT